MKTKEIQKIRKYVYNLIEEWAQESLNDAEAWSQSTASSKEMASQNNQRFKDKREQFEEFIATLMNPNCDVRKMERMTG